MVDARVHALIAAAGCGERVGGQVPKQYLAVGGKALLVHAVEAVAAHPRIGGVTVTVAAGDAHFPNLRFAVNVALDQVCGGATRAESVLNGLEHIGRHHEADWVIVHDAARPCLSAESLERLLEKGLQSPDGAILAVPVSDTLKREGGGRRIRATVSRSGLWAAQTPQLFPLARLHDALARMAAAGETATDEAAAMERAGARPLLVTGSRSNIKVTWPDDLELVRAWLERDQQA